MFIIMALIISVLESSKFVLSNRCYGSFRVETLESGKTYKSVRNCHYLLII